MKGLLIILSILISLDSYSQGTKFFTGSLAKAFEQAKKEDKLIFVDVSTTWCRPCKKMKKEILPQKKVGDFLNSNFINLSINAYNFDGLELALFYKVNSFPTFLFIDKKGNIVYKAFGFKTADQLINLAKRTLNYYHLDEEYKQKYMDGKRNYAFIIKYINALNKLDKPSEYLAEEFLSSNKLRKELKLKFVYRTINSTQGLLFRYLTENIDTIKSFYKPEEVNDKVYYLFKKDIEKYTYSGKRKTIKKILKLIKNYDFLSYDEFKIYSKLIHVKKKGNFKKFVQYAGKYFDLLDTDERKRDFIKSLYLTQIDGKDTNNIVYNLVTKLNQSSDTLANQVLLIKIAVLTKHFNNAKKQIKIAYRRIGENPSNSSKFQLKHYNNYLIKNKK